MAKQKKSYLPAIIVLTLLIAGLGLYGFSIAPQFTPLRINEISNSSGEISLALSPSSLSATQNTESSLSLTANTGSAKLMVLSVELTYDPGKVGTPTLTQGTFLGNTLASPKVENGKITFTFAATPESGGAAGTGEVAIIKFKPTSSGTSKFTFTANSVATAVKNDERIVGNSLKSADDATVTVGSQQSGGGSSTSTPTATPTSTPTPTPATNNISAITTTPKPTVKPATKKATAKPSSTTQSTAPSTYTDPDTTYQADNTLIPITSDETAETNSTSAPKPNIFQKILIGWGIIFKSIFSR